MEIINFIFKSFWHFIGFIIILCIVTDFLMALYNRFWRHWTLLKHGYPPHHCDADGDYKRKNNDN